MTFKDWVFKHCPGFEDKLQACDQELIDAAGVVDIDYSRCSLSIGLNKGSRVEVLSEDSKGRCRVYINTKDYDGMSFPQLVFINLRKSYSDPVTEKAVPAVVDTTTHLFEKYRERINLDLCKSKPLLPAAQIPNRTILVNEQRAWFAKLETYSLKKHSRYLSNSGIDPASVVNDQLFKPRMGYTTRYGQYVALPLRHPHQDTFMGFQRIYDDGKKIMLKDFNPNGLCGYLATDAAALKPSGVKVIILMEGWANSLLSHYMCKQFNLNGVVNMVGLYADNLPIIVDVLKNEFPGASVINFYDNDTNGVGHRMAQRCQAVLPTLYIDCFTRNDLRELVRDFSYAYALKEFKQKLKKALSFFSANGQ